MRENSKRHKFTNKRGSTIAVNKSRGRNGSQTNFRSGSKKEEDDPLNKAYFQE